MGAQIATETKAAANSTDTQVGTPCKMCRERGKPKNFGSEPKCAFPDGGPFTTDNWNCATANAIRDLVESDHGLVLRSYGDDQTHVMVNIDSDGLDLSSTRAEDEYRPYSLWVTWYKRRGRTQAMWLLPPEGSPRPPTEADALAVVAFCAAVRP